MGWFSFTEQIYIPFLRSLAQAHFESNLHTWFLMDPSVLSPHQLSNSECSRTKTEILKYPIMTLSWVGLESSPCFSPLETSGPKKLSADTTLAKRHQLSALKGEKEQSTALDSIILLFFINVSPPWHCLTLIKGWVQHWPLIIPFCHLSLENTSSQHTSYVWYFSHIKTNPL